MSSRSYFRWLNQLLWPLPQARPAADLSARNRFRPVLDSLEDRRLLSTIIDLGTLPHATSSEATAINASGQVVGTSLGAPRHVAEGFLYNGRRMVPINPFGGSVSAANGLNDAGQVVGDAQSPNGDTHAYLWDHHSITDLTNLAGATSGFAYGINNFGQVVGWSTSGGPAQATLWDQGNAIDLGPLTGYQYSMGVGINDSGQVAILAHDPPYRPPTRSYTTAAR